MLTITKKYIKSFEELSPKNIKNLSECVSKNFVFVDPFQTVNGKSEFETLLKNMFKRLKNPKFNVVDVSEKKSTVYLKWRFECIIFKKLIKFHGISEIYIKNNLVTKHLDYWDTGRNFYSHLPIIGKVFKKIHR